MSPRRALAEFVVFPKRLTADATRSSRIAMMASSATDIQAVQVMSEVVNQDYRL
jgi:hypothetical protein